ncbi:MAG: aminotransferase class I/II-fold pyridoxal phosphate-dependent enzyme, partial [Actinobacteria bacterium]|nr:aminotransferase class I/II-fold pyridoxal phosphate-dependent enzyme [Actinomycetota bacterium]NIU70530.1 aminotransferase class I/II-fold pyridoxal phosphate-dependent enzyme [Actinomycetota bacterium]NIV90156.1 aminotransferase class I/II-fold pyridoxal phosphate-dependent enzyme [Actinomycetota bacterium]NIW32434.1 aminotransferase class I/II-fold pyridoxal phosphate-dependent enzyme [Actinomycetota bacterium]NIX24640.1 aminotransferase class I/II-fold pyridoxal phosphate-dependent enzym
RIAAVLDAFDGPVVVDEAYVEFAAGPSLVDTMSGHANLIVLRTFSKAWGLAGARVGYLVADPRVIDALDRIDLPYPLSAPAARAATIALDRAAEMEATVRRIVAERERLAGLLDDLGA